MESLIKEIKSIKRKTPNKNVLVVIPSALYADQPKNVLPLLRAHTNKVIPEGGSLTDFKADVVFYANPTISEEANNFRTSILMAHLNKGGRLIILSITSAEDVPAAPKVPVETEASSEVEESEALADDYQAA